MPFVPGGGGGGGCGYTLLFMQLLTMKVLMMEKEMESTLVYWGYIGIMEKQGYGGPGT